MIREASVCKAKHGYELIVRDTPWAAAIVDSLYDWLLTALGSPCCDFKHGTDEPSWSGRIANRLPGGPEGWLGVRWSVLQFRLMSNRLTNGRYRSTDLARFPISTEQAAALWPDFVKSCPEDEPALAPLGTTMVTFTASTATSTWPSGYTTFTR